MMNQRKPRYINSFSQQSLLNHRANSTYENNIDPLLHTQENSFGESALLKKSSASTWGIILSIITILIWLAGLVVGFQTSLNIQAGLCFLLAIIGIFVPNLGLLIIGMLSGLNAVAAEYILTGGVFRFNTFNYLLLFVMLLSIPFLLRLRDVSSRWLQFFILLLSLELIFSKNISEGVDDILNITTTFGIIVYMAKSLNDELVFYWMGVVNGILGALVGLVFFIELNQLPYANPNNWTYLQLAALFSICFGLFFAHKYKKSKIILVFLALINTTWIFLSGSRGSLLLALICIGFIFFANRSFTLNTVLIGLAILISLWVSTQFLEQQVTTINRIQLLFNQNETESKRTSKRSELLKAGLQLFTKNPLGIGTGSFREESAQTSFIYKNRPAHSAWIKTLVENGIPGIIVLVAFILSFTVQGIRKRKEGKFLLGFFITIIFSTAFIAKEFQEKSLWFLAAYGIVILNSNEIQTLINTKLKKNSGDLNQRLREVRFGRRK
jgi:O-antigen ligase